MIVGFCGKGGHGKTTAANILVHPAIGFHRVAFAAPLKRMVQALGLSDEEIAGSLKEVPCDLLCGKTPRWAQQALGTEWGRELIHPDLWVRIWAREASKYPNVVCDDVRFHNEVETVRQAGGIIVRIVRSGTEAIANSGHASERMAFEPDMTIENDGTVEDLKRKVLALI